LVARNRRASIGSRICGDRLSRIPRFRADLPPAGDAAGEAALRAHVESLVQATRELALNSPGPEAAAAFRRGFGVKRHRFDLPGGRGKT